MLTARLMATTISVVPIYEPISLHGTDVDDAVSEYGDSLQAAVMARPMALSGAFPEELVTSVATSHRLPTNHANYKVEEVNLLVLCGIGLDARMVDGTLVVSLDISEIAIPQEISLTVRQVLNLGIEAVRRTLSHYQNPQADGLPVRIRIRGTDESTASLTDLDAEWLLRPAVQPGPAAEADDPAE